jgi:hypothetical protein
MSNEQITDRYSRVSFYNNYHSNVGIIIILWELHIMTNNRYPLGAQYSVCGASSLAGIAHDLQNASHRSLTLSGVYKRDPLEYTSGISISQQILDFLKKNEGCACRDIKRGVLPLDVDRQTENLISKSLQRLRKNKSVIVTGSAGNYRYMIAPINKTIHKLKG